jgi:ribosomal protein S18 acetylase RimI-like enzyme
MTPAFCPIIRPLNTADLPEIAELHCDGFPESTVTLLGKEAVHRYYLSRMVEFPQAQPWGAFVNGRCVGYCFGGQLSGAERIFWRRNRRYIILHLLGHPWLLRHENIRNRLPFRKCRQTRRQAAQQSNGNGSEAANGSIIEFTQNISEKKTCMVSPIVVSSQCRRMGIGRELLRQTEAWAIMQGFEKMWLSVDTRNTTAVLFYERLGWRRLHQNGAWHGVMEKPLVPKGGVSASD